MPTRLERPNAHLVAHCGRDELPSLRLVLGEGRNGEAVRIGKLGRLRQARGKNDLANNIRNEPGNKSIGSAPYPANRSCRMASWRTVSTRR